MSKIVAGLLAICEAFGTLSASVPIQFASKNSRFKGPCELIIERAGTTGGGTVWGVDLLGPGNANRQDFTGDGVATTFQTAITYAALSNNNWVCRVSKSTRTGTAAVTAASAAVVGTSTVFLTEAKVGGDIVINGERKTIIAIADDTHLTVDSVFAATASTKAIFLVDDVLFQTTDFTVSNVGGFALITVTAAATIPANATLEVHFVVPVAIFTYATATTTTARREINGYDLVWYVTGATTAPSATNIYLRPLGY